MNTPDKFNFKRFGLAARQYFSSNKKQLLGGMLVTLGFLTIIAFIIGNTQKEEYDISLEGKYSWLSPEEIYLDTINYEAVFFGFCFFVFTLISASLTFCSFKTKKKRITSLTLPVAKSEMFVLRVLIYSVLANLMFIVCCIIADALRSGLVFGPSIWSAHSIIFTKEFWEDAFPLISSNVLLGQALFTLGSALWPRNSFVISFAVGFGLLLLVMLFNPVIMYALTLLFGNTYVEHFTPRATGGIIFAIAIGVYWSAWLRFKHYQIILKPV